MVKTLGGRKIFRRAQILKNAVSNLVTVVFSYILFFIVKMVKTLV